MYIIFLNEKFIQSNASIYVKLSTKIKSCLQNKESNIKHVGTVLSCLSSHSSVLVVNQMLKSSAKVSPNDKPYEISDVL